MDPITIISTISSGLKLVDQFRDLALRFLGKSVKPPSALAEQTGDAIQITHHGEVVQNISSTQLNLNHWDQVRMQTLQRRVEINWSLFNELDAEEPLLAVDERVRIRMRMEKIKDELCEDFRGMVRIYENTLGIGLPDHYSLFEVCGG